jgi:hypothetical protein
LRDDCLHCLTRHQNAAIRLENPPSNGTQFKLGIAADEFGTVEAFIPDLALLKRFERRLAVGVTLSCQPKDSCWSKESGRYSRRYSSGVNLLE